MTGRKIKRPLIYFLSIIVFLLIWFILSKIVNAPLILPGINEVFSKILLFITTGKFWVNFTYTFIRVLIAFFISLITGTFIGILCGYSKSWKVFFDFPLAFIRSTPVIAIILVTLFWFNSSSVPVFVAVLMGLPIVVTAVTKGISEDNENLIYMADIYNFTNFQKFKYIKLKSLKPFFLNSAVSVFGLSWKVVVAGEVISIPKYGFGSVMQMAQVNLETSSVIAVTLILVILSFSIEKLFTFFVKLVNRNE